MPQLDLQTFKPTYRLGWVFLSVSFVLYLVPEFFPLREGDGLFLLFVFNFMATILYYIALVVNKYRQSKPRPNIPFACWVHLVLLYTISAFSLNRNMQVFSEFPLWLNMYTLIGASVFLAYPYYDFLQKTQRTIFWVMSGAVLVLGFYFTLYLLPIMPISILGSIFFGISLHSFVPVFWLVLIVVVMQRKGLNKMAFAAGILVPLLFIGFYLSKWHQIQEKVKDIQANNYLDTKSALPVEIALAQQLPSDKLSEEILISPYYSQRFWYNGWGLDFNGENRYHNPLAILGMAFFGELQLDQQSAEAVLNIRRDKRHLTEERLWNGISLSTSSLTNKIQVFPQQRLAYHEKILTIHNSPEQRNERAWFVRSTQQALYTFHLPEASIVTSMSLWIDGKEEKSRLTTRKKADSAFKQIVGVEQRDPAIVHWKEGNLVVVSVFPCTTQEDRVFKIGFTTPLKYKGDHLLLENIWFEGPDAQKARELTELQGEFTDLPDGFEKTADGTYTRKGNYLPVWQAKVPMQALSNQTFNFHGKAYGLKEAVPTAHPVNIQKVFFDLNQHWSEENYNDLRLAFKDKELYVMGPQLIRITEANAQKIFDSYKENRFSLPYLHLIKDPEHSLLVVNSGSQSPLLKELKQSAYGEAMENYLQQNKTPMLLINIGEDLNPLYKTLAELRLVTYLPMQVDELKNAMLKQSFSYAQETDDELVIPTSHLVIQRKDSVAADKSGAAPDHLMRLFAYNHIVKNLGSKFFSSEKYENEWFREAEEAYVLSPLTSLIVLESEEDYQRMNIQKNKDTLGNAEIMEGGSVPEPHEWALLSILLLLVAWLWFKPKQQPSL
jgi:XrtN system VIT domain protein